MQNLGNQNLFTSHFIVGCMSNINNNLESKKELNSWLKFKDFNSEMDKYRVNQTQYVDILYEIDLSIFKDYLLNLVENYKKAFPYAEKIDFINHVFAYSLFDLGNFIKREYRFLGSYSTSSNYDFYCYYEVSSNEYIDFAIPSNKTIEHFKQYFKRIIQLVNDVQFEDSDNLKFDSQTELTEIETAETPSLSISQIALKFVYEGKLINRENSEEIVKQYGHTSGDALYNKYIHYSSDANRKGATHPLTPRKLQNKIDLLESVIELVSIDAQAKIKEEVLVLKLIQENEFH